MQPPHHALFDSVPNEQKGKATLLMRQRAEDARKKKEEEKKREEENLQTLLFTKLLAVSGASSLLAQSRSTVNTNPVAVSIPVANEDTLIPSTHRSGLDMTIEEFCRLYALTEKVKNLLEEEGYDRTSSLEFASVAKLEAAGFRSGHIAALKVATRNWAILKEV